MSSRKQYGPTPAYALPSTATIASATETVIRSAANASLPLLVAIPSGSILERQVFDFVASGTITTTASGTANLKLYFAPSAAVATGTAGTLGNDTAIAASGAVTQNTTAAPFVIRGRDFFFDTVSGKLAGRVSFTVNNTLVADAAFSAVPTGLNSANDPIFGLLATITLSAGGTILCTQFDVEF